MEKKVMSNQLTAAEKELLNSLNTGRTQAEIFNSIAEKIRKSYEHTITEEESRKAARNFIAFCQKLIDIQIRIDKDKEREQKKKE
jgi:hypothetical protein